MATSAALAVATVVGALLRVMGSSDLSLRLDEAQSIQFASYPLHEAVVNGTHVASLFAATAADVQPPGYLLLLHGWMSAFGTSAGVLRLPSVIAATLCIPALFLLARSLYGRTVGLVAALVAAVAPFWIWHGQEVRMYSFLLLFSILCTYGFVQALLHQRRWGWVVFVVASVAGLYTQYFMFLVLLMLAVFLVVARRQFSRRQKLAWLGATALTALLYLPWVIEVALHHSGATDPALHAPGVYTPLVFLSEFVLGYLTSPLTSQLVAGWPVLVLLALSLGAFARPSGNGRLLWLLFAGPFVLTLVVSALVIPVASERYLIICTPALFILMAVAITRLLRSSARAIAVGVLAAVLAGASQFAHVSAGNPAAEDYRTVVSYIQAHAGPDDAVGIDAAFNQFPYYYYANNNLPTYDLPFAPDAPGIVAPALTEANLGERLQGIERGRTHLWVIFYLEPGGGSTDLVRRYLDYHTTGHATIVGGRGGRNIVGEPASFLNVQLVRYDLIPSTPATVQPRPLTVAQLRWLTGLSPTTREPFASSVGVPGARSTLLGSQLPPAAPATIWSIPGVSDATVHRRLSLFNPNLFPVRVTVTSPEDAWAGREVTIAALSNVEVDPAGLGAPQRSALRLSGSAGFVATQWGSVTGQRVVENGQPERSR